MELTTYQHIEYEARLAAETARALWSGENEKPCRGGLSMDDTLDMLRKNLALDLRDLRELPEADVELRGLYEARIKETRAEIAETLAEIAETEADIAALLRALKRAEPTARQIAGRALASKACALANGMPRKETFAKAWAIAKNGWLEISVAGVSFGSRQEALRRLANYDPESVIALLVPEPDCEHDPGAIAVQVMLKGGKGIYTIGYIPRPYAAVARAFLGRVPRLELVGGETKGARIRLAA